jgi:hypothetical protein
MTIERLEALMDRLRDAVLQADFATVSALGPKLEAALGQITGPLDAGALGRLKSKALRNAACLEAAKRGIRAALRRCEEVRSAGRGVQTYNGRGQKADIALAGPMAARY